MCYQAPYYNCVQIGHGFFVRKWEMFQEMAYMENNGNYRGAKESD